MARHVQAPNRATDSPDIHEIVREEIDKRLAREAESNLNATMILEAEALLVRLGDSVRKHQAASAGDGTMEMTGRAQRRESQETPITRHYQVSIPGLLAGTLRSTPTAVKHLRTQFRDASVVTRGRGTTATVVLRSEEEARYMLAALDEAAEKVTHRDIARAAAELRAELAS